MHATVSQMAVEALDVLSRCKISTSNQVLDTITAAAPRLVRLLGSRLSAVQLAAACVLQRVTDSQSSDRQQRLVDAGAIPMLSCVLQCGSAGSQLVAVKVLQAMAAAKPEFNAAVSAAGAAPMLIPLLMSQTSDLQCAALDCCTTLARGATKAKVCSIGTFDAHGCMWPLDL